MPAGEKLRIELTSPAIVHWTVDQWDTAHDTRTIAENGLYVADLPTASLASGMRIQFTFFWPEVNRWEGEDFEVRVQEGAVRYAT
jgi:glucoamylase